MGPFRSDSASSVRNGLRRLNVSDLFVVAHGRGGQIMGDEVKQGMKEQPEEITVCSLECLVMPQGEIICMGNTIGWFKDYKKHLTPKTIDEN